MNNLITEMWMKIVDSDDQSHSDPSGPKVTGAHQNLTGKINPKTNTENNFRFQDPIFIKC